LRNGKLTEVKRNTRASMVNMKGVVSHDEMRRMEKKAIATGMETRNRISMTRRGVGSRCEWDRGAMADPAACNAVDRRETKIEPAPPGRPKQKYGKCQREALSCIEEARTAKRDSEHRIAFIAAHECVQDSSRRAGDDNRTEKRRPARAEKWPDVLVLPDDRNSRDGAKGDDRNDDVGCGGTYPEGEDCRHCA
jgi:hypothetical protein